jgi:hypothetical protein
MNTMKAFAKTREPPGRKTKCFRVAIEAYHPGLG